LVLDLAEQDWRKIFRQPLLVFTNIFANFP
jgi:hypothetical protein